MFLLFYVLLFFCCCSTSNDFDSKKYKLWTAHSDDWRDKWKRLKNAFQIIKFV